MALLMFHFFLLLSMTTVIKIKTIAVAIKAYKIISDTGITVKARKLCWGTQLVVGRPIGPFGRHSYLLALAQT